MKIVRVMFTCLLMAATIATAVAQDKAKPAATPEPAAAKQVPNPEFDKFKRLVGNWEAKTPEGQTVATSFRLVSAGSAILISTAEPKEGDMITVVHPDGGELMATHYCSAKNQPRFVAVPSGNPNQITFKLKDVTNLASPQAGHMTGAVFTILDDNHHNETWTWSQDGKDQSVTFELTRVGGKAAGK